MNSFSKNDNAEFRKMIKRDALLHLFILTLAFIGFFLLPFVAYLGQKYNF